MKGVTNYADPVVIVRVKANSIIVMTEDKDEKDQTHEDKNQKIPNIVNEHGVTRIRFFDLLRKQRWKF